MPLFTVGFSAEEAGDGYMILRFVRRFMNSTGVRKRNPVRLAGNGRLGASFIYG